MRHEHSWLLARCRLTLPLGLLIAITVWAISLSVAAGRGESGALSATRVELRERQADLELFRVLDLDVDAVFDGWARIYLLDDEAETLRSHGYELSVLWREPVVVPESWFLTAPPAEGEWTSIPAGYHTYETLTAELQAIEAAHSDLVGLFSIGQSVQGRELWMMKISDNPRLEEDEPGMAYIAAMHGDEVVGKELVIGLINYLVDGYGTDARVTDIVNESEIWILPSMNPDGTQARTRYNAQQQDLNRAFPDWYEDPVNTPDGRAHEAQLVMAWTEENSIALSASMHGGAMVALYPWSNNDTQTDVFSPTPNPDHPAFYSVSVTYAINNPPMFDGSFTNGVSNAADWYTVRGGMMDWNYAWYGNFQITPEVSQVKWPPASQLPTFWNENLESMLAFLERGHEGLRGVVTDLFTGAAVAAEIYLDADPFPVYTDPQVGDYHRAVLPGSYTMGIFAEGYIAQTIPVTISSGVATRYDVQLTPVATDLQPIFYSIIDGMFFNLWLSPGNSVDLAVTLENEGGAATGVSGRLISTGWDGEILRADATYPDIPNQGSGVSNAPYYEIHLDGSVPPGRKIGFAVDWSADQGGAVSEPFFLNVGAPVCHEDEAVDLPKPIPDFWITTSEITVSEGLRVDELEVTVDISHTYIGDLTVTLYSPVSTAVVLHDRSGGAANDIVGTYGVDLEPVESLSLLAGEQASGIWTLAVNDQGSGETGTLNSWSLEICAPQPAALPEMRFRDLSVGANGVLLRWWPYPGVDSYKVYRATDPSSPALFVDVTGEDEDDTDATFLETTELSLAYYLISGVGPEREGPR